MKFERTFELAEKLKKESLFNEYLLPDIRKGKVFPAIRNGNMCFYYKGGLLFNFDNDNKGVFRTHKKYAMAPEESLRNYLAEEELKKYLEDYSYYDFKELYCVIKRNCEMYHANSESAMVSDLYDYSFAGQKSGEGIILLDIEIAFSNDEKEKPNRIDLLLYSQESRKLKFIEAKLYSNKELRSKTTPAVVKQIKGYKGEIQKRGQDEILPAYEKYVKVMNDLFGINISLPEEVVPDVGLLIFDFDGYQEPNVKEIKVKLAKEEIDVYGRQDLRKPFDIKVFLKKLNW